MKQNGFRRFVRAVEVSALCLVLGACLASPRVVTPEGDPPPPSRLEGILTRPVEKPERPIRIFLTHGMGIEEKQYCALASVIGNLASLLDLQQQPLNEKPYAICGALTLPAPRAIPVREAAQVADLFTVNFTGRKDKRSVQFTFLLWSPLTKPIENSELLEQGHADWALLTSGAKSFLRTHLADVVLYGGTYRKVMREAVEKALCYFVQGTPDKSDPRICNGGSAEADTVLITHSLGGYILFDSLADIGQAHAASNQPKPLSADADAAKKVLAHTELIFMLANQLAILDLTILTQWPPSVSARQMTGSIEKAEAAGILPALKRQWDASQPVPAYRQIVAISDPNDILSYLVRRKDLPSSDEAGPVVLANVYLGVATNWFNLFASPVDTHVNYLTDSDVMNIIACGMSGDAITPCPRQ